MVTNGGHFEGEPQKIIDAHVAELVDALVSGFVFWLPLVSACLVIAWFFACFVFWFGALFCLFRARGGHAGGHFLGCSVRLVFALR